MGFLSKRQPEECETSPHRLRPQYESVRRFQSRSKTKSFSEKIAIFTGRVPVENVKTLKTWFRVFSGTVKLKNTKYNTTEYDTQ